MVERCEEGGVVFGAVLYAAFDELEVLACVGVGGVEAEGTLVVGHGTSELVDAVVCIAEVVVDVGRNAVVGKGLAV